MPSHPLDVPRPETVEQSLIGADANVERRQRLPHLYYCMPSHRAAGTVLRPQPPLAAEDVVETGLRLQRNERSAR
jgi:hypothetical protein